LCASDPYDEQYSVIISIHNETYNTHNDNDTHNTYNDILYHVKQIVGVPNPRLFLMSKNGRIEVKSDFFQNFDILDGIINIMIE